MDNRKIHERFIHWGISHSPEPRAGTAVVGIEAKEKQASVRQKKRSLLSILWEQTRRSMEVRAKEALKAIKLQLQKKKKGTHRPPYLLKWTTLRTGDLSLMPKSHNHECVTKTYNAEEVGS